MQIVTRKGVNRKMAKHEVCDGSLPWKCGNSEIKDVLRLAHLGLLPVGPWAHLDVKELAQAVEAGATIDTIRQNYPGILLNRDVR